MQGGVINNTNPRGAGTYGREARYTGHKCGNCNWQGRGRDDCPNNKPEAQPNPPVGPRDV